MLFIRFTFGENKLTMEAMEITAKEKMLIDMIKQLAGEKYKYEYRYKHPLPIGWSFGDEHPRYGEVIGILKSLTAS